METKTNTILTKTSWASSMQAIQVTPNTDNKTVALTVKEDDTHGHRTFMIARKDLPGIVEMFQYMIDNPPTTEKTEQADA